MAYGLVFQGPGATSDRLGRDDRRGLERAGLGSGLASIVGDKLAFVKVRRPFLVGELTVPFAAEQTVIEVPATSPGVTRMP